MDLLYKIFIDPFVQMGDRARPADADLVGRARRRRVYALIALGFVLIFKASGVFNFAQGIMVAFAALTLVGLYGVLHKWGIRPVDVAAYGALALTILVMLALAWWCRGD